MLALTSCTGKIGGAVLDALLAQKLISPAEIVVCTSSDPSGARFDPLRERGISVRRSNYDDPASMEEAFAGCSKLFLVSTPQIEMDFGNAPPGRGRERQHVAAIDAAVKAGVSHIYYTSLAFGSDSQAGVMRAHLRTEAYLKGLGVTWTVLREGLYSESWPLYFGYYYGLGRDERSEVVIAGDGRISWTAVPDLGLATALVLVGAAATWAGKTVYLSGAETTSLAELAEVVSRVKGTQVKVRVVPVEEYVRHYEHTGAETTASVEWWSGTYKALERGECDIKDRTLSELLDSRGVKPKPIEETVKEMLTA